MQRKAMKELIEWKNTPAHKPLLIKGARQVGKTWLMKEFGRTQFKKTAYINFDANERMANLFSADHDIKRIINGVEIETGIKIDPQETLLVLDEIQECPRALAALKYFNENGPQYNVIAAGSLLGVAMHEGSSFPVGKVDFLDLYPLNFMEFLDAAGDSALMSAVESGDYELADHFSSKLSERLKNYYYTGGMPEAVAEYVTSAD
jgi:predicted AAA+ superfamily ATPase